MASLLDLAIVFALVGGLELIDRTDFALIGLAARSPGFPTWAGAALAFVITSTLAVALGTVLLAFVAPDLRYVEAAGGVILLLYALRLALATADEPTPTSRGSAFVAAFTVILLLELGDTTMILMVLLTGSLRDPVGVLVAGAAALVTVAAFASFVGGALAARLAPRTLRRLVIAALAIVGTLTLVLAAFPALVPPIFA